MEVHKINKIKYAIISDVHGNYPALQAVLEDSYKQKIDHYIFLGDYVNGLPFANEVVNKIRNISNQYTICGNHENYLRDLIKRDESEWKHDQFAGVYWNYRELTDENKDFLFSLDSLKSFNINNTTIYMAHSSNDFFGETKINDIDGYQYALMMDREPLTHDEYLKFCQNMLLNDTSLISRLHEMEEGIYLFGHFHLQWNLAIENKLLINPGSCGLPGDLDNRSPYTILSLSDNNWNVEERRIPYDIEKVEFDIKNHIQYLKTNIWPLLNLENIKTGRNQVNFYLNHVEKIAKEINDTNRPYSNHVWKLAAAKWNWKRYNQIYGRFFKS